MKPLHLIAGLAMAAMTVFNFMAPDAAFFKEPGLARIIFWHLPCAILATIILFCNTYFGARYLMSRKMDWDIRLEASTELGTIFGVVTMVTGIIFSRAQWGYWWQWDPRQVSFLMVLFLLALAIALRGGYQDEKRRAAVCSAYAVISILPSIFLIWVFPRLKQIEQASMHPSNTIKQGMLDGPYRIGVWGTFLVLSVIAYQIYLMRVKVGILEQKYEDKNGLDKNVGHGSATITVVRTVDLPTKDN